VSDPTEISHATSLADRYGTGRRRGRRAGWVVGGLLCAALLAWAVWAGASQGREPLEVDVTSYQVVGIHEVRVKLAPHFREADTDGTCLVRATAEDHTVVGELNITADQLRAARGTWIPIRTERRATTATLVRCTS
jgi:Domain of unknown function (DUF4307)